MDPRATVGGFIKRSFIHSHIQNRKCSRPCGWRRHLWVSLVSLWELMTPGGSNLTPRGMVDRIYKEDHYSLLYTKYESCGPCGVGEEDFFFYVFQ